MLKELRYGDLKYAKQSAPKDFDAEYILLDFYTPLHYRNRHFGNECFGTIYFLSNLGMKSYDKVNEIGRLHKAK